MSPLMLNIAPDILQVAVGVLIKDGRVLVSKRTAGSHLADFWEFPGGKIEPGEDLEDALNREFYEELNIRISGVSPLMEISYSYPEKDVFLRVCQINNYSGDLRGVEGQEIRWCSAGQLEKIQFPPANKLILDHVVGELQTA